MRPNKEIINALCKIGEKNFCAKRFLGLGLMKREMIKNEIPVTHINIEIQILYPTK
jgi:hypothetical protein